MNISLNMSLGVHYSENLFSYNTIHEFFSIFDKCSCLFFQSVNAKVWLKVTGQGLEELTS